MRDALLLAGLAGFVVAAAPETGSTVPAPAANASAGKAAAYYTKKVCRSETDIGTRLGQKRICRTQAEWDAARADQRRFTERGQTQGSSCLRGGAC